MSSKKLALLSVVLCCGSWAVAQSGAGGAAPAGGFELGGTELHPRFASDAAREHLNSARWNRDTASHTGANSWSKHSRFQFAQRNSNHNHSGDVSEQQHSREHDAAVEHHS